MAQAGTINPRPPLYHGVEALAFSTLKHSPSSAPNCKQIRSQPRQICQCLPRTTQANRLAISRWRDKIRFPRPLAMLSIPRCLARASNMA